MDAAEDRLVSVRESDLRGLVTLAYSDRPASIPAGDDLARLERLRKALDDERRLRGQAVPLAELPDDLVADIIAAAFHDTYERLAPEHGYETREGSRKPWGEVPEQNRSLMRATVRHLLDAGLIHV